MKYPQKSDLNPDLNTFNLKAIFNFNQMHKLVVLMFSTDLNKLPFLMHFFKAETGVTSSKHLTTKASKPLNIVLSKCQQIIFLFDAHFKYDLSHMLYRHFISIKVTIVAFKSHSTHTDLFLFFCYCDN